MNSCLVFVAVLPRVSQPCLWMWMSLLNPMRSLPFGFCGMWSSVGAQQGYSQQPMEGRYCQPSPVTCDRPSFSFILLFAYFSSESQLRHPWFWASTTFITSSTHLHVNLDLAKLVLKAVPVLKASAQGSVDLYQFLTLTSFWVLVRTHALLTCVGKRKFYSTLISVMRVHFMEMAMLAVQVCRVLQINAEYVAQSWFPKDASFHRLKLLRF